MTRQATPFSSPSRARLRAGAVGLALVVSAGTLTAGRPDAFRSGMAEAIEAMHRDMSAPAGSGPDQAFAQLMIAHHQGAIRMAELELRHGSDERLRRLAQGIIVEQGQEIETMREALREGFAAPGRAARPPREGSR